MGIPTIFPWRLWRIEIKPAMAKLPTASRSGQTRSGDPQRAAKGRTAGRRSPSWVSVPIVIGLVWTVYRYTDIVRLLLAEPSQVDADFLDVQARDFFVELLR